MVAFYLDDVVAGPAVEATLVRNPPVHRRALGTGLREAGLTHGNRKFESGVGLKANAKLAVSFMFSNCS